MLKSQRPFFEEGPQKTEETKRSSKLAFSLLDGFHGWKKISGLSGCMAVKLNYRVSWRWRAFLLLQKLGFEDSSWSLFQWLSLSRHHRSKAGAFGLRSSRASRIQRLTLTVRTRTASKRPWACPTSVTGGRQDDPVICYNAIQTIIKR